MSLPTPPSLSVIARSAVRRGGAAALVLIVAACASRAPAPIEERAPRTLPPIAATPQPPPPPASPEAKPSTYTVKRGDTLRQIAVDNGLDPRDLAAWNNLENANVIRVGQVLRLSPPGETATGAQGVVTAPLKSAPPVVSGDAGAPAAAQPAAPIARNSDNYKTQPKALKEPYSEQALREVQQAGTATPAAASEAPAPPVAAAAPTPQRQQQPIGLPPMIPAPSPSTLGATPPAPAAAAPRAAEPAPPPPVASAEPKSAPPPDGGDEKLDWVWPAKGKVVAGFSEAASLKGIDIAGTAGQPITASAAGKVVYAGTGLRGYGKLIIIKHNGTFLSAYAHNRDILVKEGQQVSRGQKIAEMGNTDTDQVKLHFEIRRNGKPMDPLRYLPPA